MEEQKEKLKKLQEDCMKQATLEAESINGKLELSLSQTLNQSLHTFSQEQEIVFENEIRKIQNDMNAQKYEIDRHAKMQILQTNKALQQELKSALTEKIQAFVASEAYYPFLQRRIEEAIRKVKNGKREAKGITVQITESDDKVYHQALQEAFPSIHIMGTLSNNAMGGCECQSQVAGILVDATLTTEIEETMQAGERG